MSVYLQKAVPVTVLVTNGPVAAEEVCTSTDLVEEEDLGQSSRLPIVTTIEGATSSGDIKPYFQGRVALGILATSQFFWFFKPELNGLMYCSGAGKGSYTCGSSFKSALAWEKYRKYLMVI